MYVCVCVRVRVYMCVCGRGRRIGTAMPPSLLSVFSLREMKEKEMMNQRLWWSFGGTRLYYTGNLTEG